MKKLSFFFTLIFAIKLSEFTVVEAADVEKNVFDRDDRVPMLSSEGPWRKIVKIFFKKPGNNTYQCTGTLVGDDLVLTNAHCVADENGVAYTDIQVLPLYVNGKGTYSSYVTKFWYGHAANTRSENDWALARLRSPLGRHFGYMGTMVLNDEEVVGRKVTMAGHSGDFHGGATAGIHHDCQITQVRSYYYLHDCDSTGGSSGSALFISLENKEQRIVGLHRGAYLQSDGNPPPPGVPYSHDVANIAVKAIQFHQQVLDLRASEEGKSDMTWVHLCNKSSEEWIYVAMAYLDEGKWASQGWWTLEKNTCKEIPIQTRFSGSVYFHAKSVSSSTVWGGGTLSHCVDQLNSFNLTFSGTETCQRENFREVRFSPPHQVEFGNFNSYHFL